VFLLDEEGSLLDKEVTPVIGVKILLLLVLVEPENDTASGCGLSDGLPFGPRCAAGSTGIRGLLGGMVNFLTGGQFANSQLSQTLIRQMEEALGKEF